MTATLYTNNALRATQLGLSSVDPEYITGNSTAKYISHDHDEGTFTYTDEAPTERRFDVCDWDGNLDATIKADAAQYDIEFTAEGEPTHGIQTYKVTGKADAIQNWVEYYDLHELEHDNE